MRLLSTRNEEEIIITRILCVCVFISSARRCTNNPGDRARERREQGLCGWDLAPQAFHSLLLVFVVLLRCLYPLLCPRRVCRHQKGARRRIYIVLFYIGALLSMREICCLSIILYSFFFSPAHQGSTFETIYNYIYTSTFTFDNEINARWKPYNKYI